jgi:hypothetical protein
MQRPSSLTSRIESALLWGAAFAYATGVFFSATLALAIVPPTRPVAVGLVTILRYAKFKDYIAAALFFLLVPALTIVFRRLGERLLDREQRFLAWRHPSSGRDVPLTLLFTVPFFLSPFFYLTTGKVGWVLLLSPAIAYAGMRMRLQAERSHWLRQMFGRELHPYHGLLFAEALSWIVFHDIVTGHRFAHISTLFLESVFVALFVALFWAVALLITRLVELNTGRDADQVFRRITTAAIPFIVLPLAGIVWVPTTHAAAIVIVIACIVALLAMRVRPLPPRGAWITAACVMMPLLVFFVSYACTAHLSQWVDLFHRGESIGPASDYLRGKAPYRQVFALHGMLQDGLLDAWLMEIFGRSLDVAIARDAIVGGFLGVSIWYLGVALFESIPLACVVMATGILTTAENDRTFFQVVAVALYWLALRRRSRILAVLSGIVSAVALFFSYEIGMYSISGAIAVAVLLWIVAKRVEWPGLAPMRAAMFFLIGVALGALPFVLYLQARKSLGEFIDISFVEIPRIIDAVWSLPFPDLVAMFRTDLTLRTIADFVVQEKFHLILTPLTLAIAAVYYTQRVIRRRADMLDHALMVIGVFALIVQRTAFGRAEFRHQYFSAFLTGPMLALLAIFAVRELRRSWQGGDEGTRVFVAAVVVAAIPLIGTLLWVPDLINWRIGDLVDYQRRVLRVQRDPHAEEVWNRIEAVSGEIGALTKKDEPIFDFSNQPAFYFFANRPNPTRFYQVPIASPPEYQAEIIRDLERAKPKVVIRTAPEGFDEFDGIPNALRAQGVAAYLDDCYRFYRSLRGVELWTRDAGAHPKPLREYLANFRVPQQKDLVSSARQRMVFPTVGTIWGASGAFWVSDLTLHNPWREPIEVSLRFVSGESRIDRRVELAPRQTIRWPDTVRSFFGLPGGMGTLWIEYREGHAPIAVAKTTDVAHGGRASLETPLTNADVAIAGSPRPELTIVGIPAATTGGRRINIGVVNMGMIPATFRITARNRNGVVVGGELESGVPEDELWFVSDVEKQLGISIEDATTIRVTAIAGTGVAFASIVDPGGDTQFIAALPAQQ